MPWRGVFAALTDSAWYHRPAWTASTVLDVRMPAGPRPVPCDLSMLQVRTSAHTVLPVWCCCQPQRNATAFTTRSPLRYPRGRAARSRGCPSDGPILHREIQHAYPQLGHDPERCPGVLDDVGEQFGDHQDRVIDHVRGQPPPHQQLTHRMQDPADGRVERRSGPLRAPWPAHQCQGHATAAPIGRRRCGAVYPAIPAQTDQPTVQMHDRHPTRQPRQRAGLPAARRPRAITPGRILRFVVAVAKDRCPPSARAGHAARRRSAAAALLRPVTPAVGQQELRPRRGCHCCRTVVARQGAAGVDRAPEV